MRAQQSTHGFSARVLANLLHMHGEWVEVVRFPERALHPVLHLEISSADPHSALPTLELE